MWQNAYVYTILMSKNATNSIGFHLNWDAETVFHYSITVIKINLFLMKLLFL